MLAKLENLGSFQLFFTLSCADLRWEENFAAILRDQGLNVIYSTLQNELGHYYIKIEVEFPKDGGKEIKELKEYLAEEVNSSLHEMIRGNVLLATRYFNDRVKNSFTSVSWVNTIQCLSTITQKKLNFKTGEHVTFTELFG